MNTVPTPARDSKVYSFSTLLGLMTASASGTFFP